MKMEQLYSLVFSTVMIATSVLVIFLKGSQAGNLSFAHEFFKVMESSAFVDKTMLIKYFFENTLHNYVIFDGPKRFGKTLNLDMLTSFAMLEVNKSDASIIDAKLSGRYKLFKSEKLAISKETELFDRHFGRYPVIRLNFLEIECDSLDSFIKTFSAMMRRAYLKYKFILFILFILQKRSYNEPSST